MTASIKVSPPNSLVLVSDALDIDAADFKMFERGESFTATPTGIAISCLMYQDGPTNVTLGPPRKTTARPAFTGFIDTPSHEVAAWTIEGQKLLSAKVPSSRTKIQIWTNRLPEPDDVYIGLGE